MSKLQKVLIYFTLLISVTAISISGFQLVRSPNQVSNIGSGGFNHGTRAIMLSTLSPFAGSSPVYNANGQITACVGTGFREVDLPTPVRVLDTRVPIGVSTAQPLAAGSTTVISVASVVPGASAVIGTITFTNAQIGYGTLWAGGTRPIVSNINVAAAGATVADLALVPLSSSGTFSLFNQNTTDAVFDVSGGLYPVQGAVNLIDPASQSCPSGYQQVSWPANNGITVFSTPTTTTYTIPSGTNWVQAKLWGAGGGAGGYNATNGSSGGGGGGAVVTAIIPTAGCTSLSIVVGLGGAAGTASVAGGNGGGSSVSCATAAVSAQGGVGSAVGGVGGGGGSFNFTGTAIGVSSVGGQAGSNSPGLTSGGSGGNNGGGSGSGSGANIFSGPGAGGVGGGGGGGSFSSANGAAGGNGMVIIQKIG